MDRSLSRSTDPVPILPFPRLLVLEPAVPQFPAPLPHYNGSVAPRVRAPGVTCGIRKALPMGRSSGFDKSYTNRIIQDTMAKKMTIEDLARLIHETVAKKEDLAAVTGRLDSVDARLGAMDGRMNALAGRLDAMESTLALIHADVKDVKRDTSIDIIDLRQRVARIEDKLNIRP